MWAPGPSNPGSSSRSSVGATTLSAGFRGDKLTVAKGFADAGNDFVLDSK